MTRTALAPTPSLPPCMLAPELWDSSDNTEAIAACRQQCPRRFACAQEALTGPKHLVSTLNGVIAGVAIPAQNEYGTSKAHKAALKRLETIAELGRAASAATANPCARSQRAAALVDQDEALTIGCQAKSTLGRGPRTSSCTRARFDMESTGQTEVLVLPRGGWRADLTPRPRQDIPHGQFDVRDVARMTGLTEKHLRYLRSRGAGPKSWLNSSGGIRYWATTLRPGWLHAQITAPSNPPAQARNSFSGDDRRWQRSDATHASTSSAINCSPSCANPLLP